MCNACNNICCGSDEFGGCGCEFCEEPECWPEDPEDDDDEDYYVPPRSPDVPLAAARGFFYHGVRT